MPHESHLHRRLLATLVACLAVPLAVAADGPAPARPRVSRSQNVTINLINRLVERGALTKQDATELIQLAEEDAAQAKAEAAQAQAQAGTASAQPEPESAPIADDTVRVTYVPENVKAQIRDEVKQEVMTEARKENWAAPNTFPDWVSRFTFFGDFRMRYEGNFFPSGNDNTGAFPNFNAINTGSPFDVSGTLFSPQYNVDQARNRFRLRARLGAAIDLGDGFTSGIRFGTGENDSPVTENQTLGVANGGQGGNFSKNALWLDRAFLKYEQGGQPDNNLAVTVGRFDNPFFATNMIWADDLGFDGAVFQDRRQIAPGLTPFLTLGAFPVFNTDFNFATNQPAKFKSEDKWLYAAQLGADWKVNDDLSAKAGAAYYFFQNVEGKLSSPFTPLLPQDSGNTDDSRPAFAQTGNTYMALRNIVPSVLNNFGAIDQFQYFGLATPFHELALTAQLNYDHFNPFQVSLAGEYVNNLAFHRGRIAAVAVNNRGAASSAGGTGPFLGGGTAWIVNLKFGDAVLQNRWDWNALIGYRYVESDSLVDGFADADFGGSLLGTNHKGFVIGGAIAVTSRVSFGLRWMSATEIAGPIYKNDLIQMDINSKF